MNIIEDNKKLVYKIANYHYKRCKEFDVEDLAQVGFMTLAKSGEKFDPSRGAVSTFITHCVNNAISGFTRTRAKKNTKEIGDYDKGVEADTMNLEEYFPDNNSDEFKVCKMLQEGYNRTEISKKMNTSVWIVNGVIGKIKERMRRYK